MRASVPVYPLPCWRRADSARLKEVRDRLSGTIAKLRDLINIVSFATSYKIIKDKATQRGRAAPRKWPYYDILEDMLAGDPAVVPLSTEQSVSVGTSDMD